MSNPQFVVPICSAMGFAYVCKLTGCDARPCRAFALRPLRHVRWLMIPGGIAVAFFVNSAIVSQTSTVSVVGPVLIPLLLAAGFSRLTAGALLLLGGSMGGELLNPAAVEVTAVKNLTGASANDVIAHLLPYNLLASGTALLVFWAMALWYERSSTHQRGNGEVRGRRRRRIPRRRRPGARLHRRDDEQNRIRAGRSHQHLQGNRSPRANPASARRPTVSHAHAMDAGIADDIRHEQNRRAGHHRRRHAHRRRLRRHFHAAPIRQARRRILRRRGFRLRARYLDHHRRRHVRRRRSHQRLNRNDDLASAKRPDGRHLRQRRHPPG